LGAAIVTMAALLFMGAPGAVSLDLFHLSRISTMRFGSILMLLLGCATLASCGGATLESAALAEPAAPARAARTSPKGAAYLDTELRREVDALVAAIDSAPTTADNCGERARVLWRWANAWALTGRPV